MCQIAVARGEGALGKAGTDRRWARAAWRSRRLGLAAGWQQCRSAGTTLLCATSCSGPPRRPTCRFRRSRPVATNTTRQQAVLRRPHDLDRSQVLLCTNPVISDDMAGHLAPPQPPWIRCPAQPSREVTPVQPHRSLSRRHAPVPETGSAQQVDVSLHNASATPSEAANHRRHGEADHCREGLSGRNRRIVGCSSGIDDIPP